MSTSTAVSQFVEAAVEAARLDALNELQIMDTQPEQAFDDLVWIASRLCDVPIALISLVDGHRQWFKARCGLDALETPRDVAFCAHALASDDLFEVPDALLDDRFARNPLVLGEPRIRYYAGVPLTGRDGLRFGTLCVIDRQPRSLTAVQREGLHRLARQASANLETRRLQRLASARENTLSQLLEALPDAVVTCDGAGLLREFNHAARAWHGVDVRELPPAEWALHFDLYDADGIRHLAVDEVPLARAWKGERVREARIVIRAKGQPVRYVSCNADPLLGVDGEPLGAVCVMHDVTQLMLAQEAALVDAQRFTGAFAAASQGMALVSTDGRWLDVNASLCDIFGYSHDELLQLDFQQLTHPADLGGDLALVDDVLAGRRATYQLDKRYLHRSGRIIHAHLSVSLVRDAKGAPLHFVSQIQDLTHRHLTEQRLRASEERLRTVADNVPALIGHVGPDLRYEFVNQPYADWCRRPADDIVGRHMSDVLLPDHFATLRPRLEQVLAGETVTFEIDVPDRGGDLRHMSACYIPDRRMKDGAGEGGFHLMVHDVTPQTRLARMLKERALTDDLTGLPNRAAWNAELERGVARAQRGDNAEPITVMFLDLDGFKQVNDNHGHAAGDTVLQTFASRLQASLRKTDFIARLSGDEFVVMLDRASAPRCDLAQVAEKIRDVLRPAILVDGRALHLRPSIGFAVQASADADITRLMQAADEAMYEAKRRKDLPYAVRNLSEQVA